MLTFYPCLLLAAWQTSRQLAVACGSIVMASPAGGSGGKLCGVGPNTVY